MNSVCVASDGSAQGLFPAFALCMLGLAPADLGDTVKVIAGWIKTRWVLCINCKMQSWCQQLTNESSSRVGVGIYTMVQSEDLKHGTCSSTAGELP